MLQYRMPSPESSARGGVGALQKLYLLSSKSYLAAIDINQSEFKFRLTGTLAYGKVAHSEQSQVKPP